MNEAEKKFLEQVTRKNRSVVAKYFALYAECSDMKKCMITLTPPDGKLSTLITIRQEFLKKLHKYKKNKDDVKYFSNIEFTPMCIPHLHIQLFFIDKNPIYKAYNYIVNHNNNNTSSNDITYANDDTKKFTYVIKDYLDTDITLEKFKATQKILYNTSSRKTIPNIIVKFLFSNILFKSKINKYQQLLQMIEDKTLIVKKGDITKFPNKDIQIIRKIGNYTVVVYNKKKNIKKGKTQPYKIKRIIKSRKNKIIPPKPFNSLADSKRLFKIYKSWLNP